MKNEILYTGIQNTKIEEISKIINDSLIKHRFKLVISFAIMAAFICCVKIIDAILIIKEFNSLWTSNCFRPDSLIRVPEKEFKELKKYNSDHGNGELKNLCVKGSRGSRFFYNEKGYELYSKTKALQDPKFNPDGCTSYKDIFYINREHPIFKDVERKGYSCNHALTGTVVKMQTIQDAMYKKAKPKFGKDTELLLLNRAQCYMLKAKIGMAKSKLIDEKQKEIKEKLKLKGSLSSEDTKIDASNFARYEVLGEFQGTYFVGCKKGELDPYKQDLQEIEPGKEIRKPVIEKLIEKPLSELTEEESNLKEIEQACQGGLYDPEDIFKISPEDYKSLLPYDREFGFGELEIYSKESFKGNMFVYCEAGHRAYSKADFLRDPEFNPSKSKEYKDIFYINNDHPLFKDIQPKGRNIPNFKKGVVCDEERLHDIMKEKAKDLYDGQAEVSYFSKRELSKIIKNIEKAKTEAIKQDSKIDQSQFDCFIKLGEFESRRLYIAHKKDALTPYL